MTTEYILPARLETRVWRNENDEICISQNEPHGDAAVVIIPPGDAEWLSNLLLQIAGDIEADSLLQKGIGVPNTYSVGYSNE